MTTKALLIATRQKHGETKRRYSLLGAIEAATPDTVERNGLYQALRVAANDRPLSVMSATHTPEEIDAVIDKAIEACA
jgi:hypothetical protein